MSETAKTSAPSESPRRSKRRPFSGPKAFWVQDGDDMAYLLDPEQPLTHGCRAAYRWKDGTITCPLNCVTKRPERAKTIALKGPYGDVARGLKRKNVLRVVGMMVAM